GCVTDGKFDYYLGRSISDDCHIFISVQKFNTNHFRFSYSFSCCPLIVNGDGWIERRELTTTWRRSERVYRCYSPSTYFNSNCNQLCSYRNFSCYSLSYVSKVRDR